jgi:hypothetical protein
VESITDEEVVFRNFQGETYRYPLKTSAIAPVGDAIPSPGAPIVVF